METKHSFNKEEILSKFENSYEEFEVNYLLNFDQIDELKEIMHLPNNPHCEMSEMEEIPQDKIAVILQAGALKSTRILIATAKGQSEKVFSDLIGMPAFFEEKS
jgi:hypothetical protein